MKLIEHVGNRLRELRQARGQSQDDVAKALKVTPNTVSRWETGVYKTSIEDLDALARHFGVSIMSFFPEQQNDANTKVAALLRAAEGLKDDDLEELRRYAEFRRARHLYDKPKAPKRRKKDGE